MSISVKTLNKAIKEAERFLDSAQHLRDTGEITFWGTERIYERGGECVSVKRASMDLSKLLVKVRKAVPYA